MVSRRRPARAATLSVVDQPASPAERLFAAVAIGAMLLTAAMLTFV